MKKKIIAAWIVTGLWILFWSINAYLNWAELDKLKYNEWGDFFAGVSTPLAFLWLVVGYFQQGEELSQNTKALEQQ